MIRELLDVLGCSREIILGYLGRLLELLCEIHGITTDVTDGDLRCLTLLLNILRQLLTSLLGELREYETDDGTIVYRIDTELGQIDGLLDLLQHALIPWLNLDETCLRDGNIAHLLDRGRCAVVVHRDTVEYVRVRTACADGRKLVHQIIVGLVHLFDVNGKLIIHDLVLLLLPFSGC